MDKTVNLIEERNSMKYEVIMKGRNPLIEEEIDVIINSVHLRCFMPYGSVFPLEEGEKYWAEIDGVIFDAPVLKEIHLPVKKIQCGGKDFSHKVCGIMDIDMGLVHSSIDIYLDSAYLYDFAYLDGHFVELVIDRFDIEFLEPLLQGESTDISKTM